MVRSRNRKGAEVIPVLFRVDGGARNYTLYETYETFEKAAQVVHRLRTDPTIAWAYIPDEYAPTQVENSQPNVPGRPRTSEGDPQ